MMEDRGLRPLKNWVCGVIEHGGCPGTVCMVFMLRFWGVLTCAVKHFAPLGYGWYGVSLGL